MPTYEYRCTACGREFEVMHGVHGTGPETCEVCGGALRKMISAPAVHFKGSGWAGKDARDSGRARSTRGTATDSKTTTDASKPSTDGVKTSGDGAASSPTPAAESSTKAAPASSGAGEGA